MRAKEFIVERRDRMLQYIKQVLPTYPDYVIKDLVYNIARGKWPKKYSKFDENSIIDMLTYIGLEADTPWKLEKLNFNIDMFEEESKRMLIRDIQEQSRNAHQGVAEGTDNKPTIGINIRNDGDIHYADLIVDGKKKYESRMTNSLKPYIGKTVGIVRTGNGPATAIGQVTIGEPIIFDAEEFNKLRNQHLVPNGSKFDIEPNGTKYLYPMINPIRWDNEKPISHKGIVSRKIQENEYDTRTDDERHDVQSKLAKQQGGVRNEPVILVMQPDGKYKLIEGWHRTAQHFVLHPNGYVGPAWVAYPNYINEDMSRRAFGLGALGALAGVGAQAKTQKPLEVTGYYNVVVPRGGTVFNIARGLKMDTPGEIKDIYAINNMNPKTQLQVGQQLKIPVYGKIDPSTDRPLPKHGNAPVAQQPVVPGKSIYSDPNDTGAKQTTKVAEPTKQVAQQSTPVQGSKNALKEPGFREKLDQIASKLGVSSRALLGLMSHETFRTFNPSMQAPPQHSRTHPGKVIPGAVGLIQFTHSTANELGTSTEELKRMSGTQQLDYVYKFLKDKAKPGMDEGDLYMSIFLPAMVGKSPNTVVGKKDSRQPIVPGGVTLHDIWDGNPTFGKSQGKNYFTIQDVKDEVSKFLHWQ